MPPPPPSPTGQERILGTLIVIVLRAKNLPNRVRIGKQNPYATVTYGLHKKRTPTIERGGQQPEWDAEFRFEILREGLGGEEQLAADSALVNSSGGVGPALPSKEGGGLGSRLDKPRPSLVAAPQTTGYPPGKRVLKIACYADDARDPKLIGEGELDIENTIKSGKHDDWVKLERKGRYAGEVYLELTWYSNDPRPVKPVRREPSEGSPTRAPSAYGGAGSRVEPDEYEDSEQSGTEEWDGGSQVGLSAPGSSNAPAVDLGADYPDADLAPLNRSMSAMALSARPPLSQPPPTSLPPSASAYHVHRLSSSQSYQHLAEASLSSHTHVPQGSYGHEPTGASSYPYPSGSYTPAPQHQQAYGGYGGNPGEFGAYQGQHPPPPPSLSQHQQPLGEFEQLAQQHYASQGYPQESTSSHRPLPQPQYSAPPPPPANAAYDSYATTQSYQPYQQHSAVPSQTPYPQPPLPPIPPSGSTYWQQNPPGTAAAPLPASTSYPTLPHSDSQSTIYAPPQPPQPPAPPSAFSPPPPPPSIANSFSSYGAPPSHPSYLPQSPQPPSFAAPPVFSPPPPPPSLRGSLPPAPDSAYPPSDHGAPPPQQPYAQPAPPLPPLPPTGSFYPPPPPPSNPYDPSPPAGSPHGSTFSPYPQSHYSTPPAGPGEYVSPPPGPYGSVSARAPLPHPPASAAGHRPLPGMFGQ